MYYRYAILAVLKLGIIFIISDKCDDTEDDRKENASDMINADTIEYNTQENEASKQNDKPVDTTVHHFDVKSKFSLELVASNISLNQVIKYFNRK